MLVLFPERQPCTIAAEGALPVYCTRPTSGDYHTSILDAIESFRGVASCPPAAAESRLRAISITVDNRMLDSFFLALEHGLCPTSTCRPNLRARR